MEAHERRKQSAPQACADIEIEPGSIRDIELKAMLRRRHGATEEAGEQRHEQSNERTPLIALVVLFVHFFL
jgi:hypothetical protein